MVTTRTIILLIKLLLAMDLTPVSITVTKEHDSWQLFVNLDGLPTGYWTGFDISVRNVERSYLLRNIGPSPIPADWTAIDHSPWLGPCDWEAGGWGGIVCPVPISLPMTFTIYIPAGGRFDYVCEVYKAKVFIQSVSGTIQASPFDINDPVSRCWCTTGPSGPVYQGCLIFDTDGDLDIDMRDWSNSL